MFLIMSAAYVGQELQTEFGRIPPSFLPLGNRRLFLHQIKLAPKQSRIYLTIPENYNVSRTDSKLLRHNNVEVIRIPENLSLGESLVSALNLSEHDFEEPLELLFGDTLFTELPKGLNFASISKVKDNYHWAVTDESGSEWIHQHNDVYASFSQQNERKAINGYFKFSSPRKLLRCLAKSHWNFLEALNNYKKETDFKSQESSNWLDFGHVNTYYSSKANFTTQRAFNELQINSRWVEKSSHKEDKIAAEANWFASLPSSLREFTPQFLGSKSDNGKISYKLEYLHLTALNELFVFSELPNNTWQQILVQCITFLKACRKQKKTKETRSNELCELFERKTRQRLQLFCEERGYSLEKQWSYQGFSISLNDLIETSTLHLPDDNKCHSILHGDFCFSNILYDFRACKIKTIDPRGITVDGELTLYGDFFYDIAKLSHSIIGLYDWIIAGYYEVNIEGNTISFEIDHSSKYEGLQRFFIELMYDEFSLTIENILAMQIQLFLSMLPLHSDDNNRQDALFANAFRLFKILSETKRAYK